MKIKYLYFLFFFSSCSLTELTLSKRLYNKGFYVDYKKNEKNNIEEIIQKNNSDSAKNKIKIQENTIELTASNFVDETHNEVQNNFENNNLPDQITKLKPAESLTKKIIFSKNKTNIESEEKTAKRSSLISLSSSFISSFLIITILLGGLPTFFFISNLVLSLVFIILTIVFALSALKKYKNISTPSKWKWMAICGLTLGIIGGIIWSYYGSLLIIYKLFSGL
jgi:cation transport ATPase